MLNTRAPLRNEHGMAIMELIPIMIIIVILVNYSLGFFGAIHTGILNSIAARNYAFSTFNHRANLMYFRDTTGSSTIHFAKVGSRLHATVSENSPDNATQFFAASRPIDFLEKAEAEGSPEVHNKKIYDVIDGKRNETNGVSPIWVRPQYGICLDSVCGPAK
jgi:hypothetical protein